jgi:hypothetical protein
MKKVYLLSGVILLLVLALSTQTFLAASDDDKNKEVVKLQDDNEDCLTPTYQLYPEAAKMWKDSWVHYYKKDSMEEHRVLTAENLIELKKRQTGTNPDAEGLRFYYSLLNNNAEVPELIIVNTLNCQDMTGRNDIALLITAEGSKEITMREAARYTLRWQSKRSQSGKTSVYAYNYRWDQITALVGKDMYNDLNIEYGLRTLSPDENQTEFEPAAKNSEGDEEEVKYGSIVYVNVLSVVSQSLLTEEDGQLDNFARPCPRYCDPDSTILSNYQELR